EGGLANGGPAGGAAIATFTDTTSGDADYETSLAIDVSEWEDGTYTLKLEAVGDAGVADGEVHSISCVRRRTYGIRGGQVKNSSAESLEYNAVTPSDANPSTADAQLGFTANASTIPVQVRGEADTDLDWRGSIYREHVVAASGGA